jgi:hypothetical protein
MARYLLDTNASIFRWFRPRSFLVRDRFRELDPEDTAYVIHARPLTDREKKRERRKER